MTDKRKLALAKFLVQQKAIRQDAVDLVNESYPTEAIFEDRWKKHTFCHGMEKYLVITRDEGRELAKPEILNLAWSLESKWLTDFFATNNRQYDDDILYQIKSSIGPHFNPILRALLKEADLEDKLVDTALLANGYSYWLASSDWYKKKTTGTIRNPDIYLDGFLILPQEREL